ncbi:N-acyl homoserine lactonase family protein [Belnapia sp. T6]|uniref:N-acyl homoserine lactonase family protein n=1 Tax=Belnapia mucosa TaxID=2804532 RepID=A0ABS1V4M1_9PROT|nr:N-acyl homoserine lactonase family protein [Belnapia mucosa]MBL6456648.1 N-acyl homoserine lactonase family protein [Belnapia mucosa]
MQAILRERAGRMAGIGDHSIWSFCFAKGVLPCDFIRGSPIASNTGTHEIPMIYSAIRPAGTDRLFLVDTGFAGGDSMTGRRFADVETPEEVLGKVGLAPAQVDTILLTHLHFDHAGNIDAFPGAEIIVQRSEYEGWQRALAELEDNAAGKQSWVLSSLNLDDIARMERAVAAGRVRFVEGDVEVFPGITLRLEPESHSFGSQWVEVATPDGPFVLAGDVLASYANIERMWPPGYHQGNGWRLLQGYRRLRALVGEELHRIVPGHDMEVFRRVPSRVIGRNPVAELHLARGDRSFLGSEA